MTSITIESTLTRQTFCRFLVPFPSLPDDQVYILKRRYAAKQAGNMLDRPSLLLNLNDNPGALRLRSIAERLC